MATKRKKVTDMVQVGSKVIPMTHAARCTCPRCLAAKEQGQKKPNPSTMITEKWKTVKIRQVNGKVQVAIGGTRTAAPRKRKTNTGGIPKTLTCERCRQIMLNGGTLADAKYQHLKYKHGTVKPAKRAPAKRRNPSSGGNMLAAIRQQENLIAQLTAKRRATPLTSGGSGWANVTNKAWEAIDSKVIEANKKLRQMQSAYRKFQQAAQ